MIILDKYELESRRHSNYDYCYWLQGPGPTLTPSQISFVIRGNKIKDSLVICWDPEIIKLKEPQPDWTMSHVPECLVYWVAGFRNNSSCLIGPGPDKVKTMEMWMSGPNQLSVMRPGSGQIRGKMTSDVRTRSDVILTLETLMWQVGIQLITGALNQTRDLWTRHCWIFPDLKYSLCLATTCSD